MEVAERVLGGWVSGLKRMRVNGDETEDEEVEEVDEVGEVEEQRNSSHRLLNSSFSATPRCCR